MQKPAQLYRCSQASAPQQGTASPGRRSRSGRMRRMLRRLPAPQSRSPAAPVGFQHTALPQTPTRVPRKLRVHEHHAEPQPLLHKPRVHKPPCPQSSCPQTPCPQSPCPQTPCPQSPSRRVLPRTEPRAAGAPRGPGLGSGAGPGQTQQLRLHGCLRPRRTKRDSAPR